MAASLIGSLGEFNPNREDWINYQKRLEVWLKANKIADTDKSDVFLALIGPEPFELLVSYLSPEDPTTKTYEELTKILADHYKFQRNEISERIEFKDRKQNPGESVSDFIVDLKRLSRYCNFGTNLHTQLRDAFVGGLREPAIRRKLLSQGNSLTWQKACSEALTIEQTELDVKSQSQGAAATVNRVTGKTNQSQTWSHGV